MDDVVQVYADAATRGVGVAGQLTETFQSRLAQRFGGVQREECDFYHTMDFGQNDLVPGVWDLRGRERSYLGWVDVAGQRVLEIGPASGYVTHHMEKEGGDVVCFELPPCVAADIIPQEGHDFEAQNRLSVGYTERVRNSWWYAHTLLGSKSKAVYGDIYALPEDLGRFDVTLLASVLLHLANPFRALQQTATRTDRAVVVTEPIHQIPTDEGRAIMEFAPVDTTKTVVVWWQLTPGAIIRMLRIFGFLEFSVYYHLQRHHPHHAMDSPFEESLFFTVVAERHPGWARRHERTPEDERVEQEVRRQHAPTPTTQPPLSGRPEPPAGGLASALRWLTSRGSGARREPDGKP
jgi:hypothetical protein